MTPQTDNLQSPESEKLLLASALDLNRKGLVDTLLSLIAASDFSVEHHGVLWNCIRMLHETSSPHDVTAVLDYTRSKNIFVGGVEFLASLVEDPLAQAASDESVIAAASRVKNYSAMRTLEVTLADARARVLSGAVSLDSMLSYLDDTVQSLRKTLHTDRTGPIPMYQVMEKVMLTLEQQSSGEITPGATTGYADVDQMINGLADEDFVVIGARPSMGKTTLGVNICENVEEQTDLNVLMFSMEMKSVSVGNRSLARKARVDLSKINRGEMADEDWGRVVEGIESMRNSRMWIDDSPGLTLHDIRARARTFVRQHGKTLILVDYLQYVSQSNPNDDTRNHVSAVSRGLKNLARELRCPVVALSQLSRSLESRTNKRPLMSDLRESGAIEQDADIIMFIYRDEVYNAETKEPGIAEIIVGKNRNGPTGVAKLGYTNNTSTFFNLSSAY